MKKTLAPIAGSAAILLALTACGESEEDQALRGMLDCPEDRSIEDCQEEQEAEIAESTEEWGDEPEVSSEQGDEGGDVDPAREASELFRYDQTAVYRDPDTGQEMGVFSIQYIDAEYDCEGSSAIAASVYVSTVGEGQPVSLSAEDFYLINEDGEFLDGAPAEGCEAALEVPQDSEGEGVLVFDAESSTGAIGLDSEQSSAFWEF